MGIFHTSGFSTLSIMLPATRTGHFSWTLSQAEHCPLLQSGLVVHQNWLCSRLTTILLLGVPEPSSLTRLPSCLLDFMSFSLWLPHASGIHPQITSLKGYMEIKYAYFALIFNWQLSHVKKKKFIWLCWVLVASYGLFHCNAQAVECVGSVALQHVGSQFPDQGSNPCPLHWKADSLTTRPPGKSPVVVFFFFKSHLLRPLEALLYCLIALKIIDEKPVVSLNSAPLRWPIWSLWGIIGSTDYLWCSRSLQKSI